MNIKDEIAGLVTVCRVLQKSGQELDGNFRQTSSKIDALVLTKFREKWIEQFGETAHCRAYPTASVGSVIAVQWEVAIGVTEYSPPKEEVVEFCKKLTEELGIEARMSRSAFKVEPPPEEIECCGTMLGK